MGTIRFWGRFRQRVEARKKPGRGEGIRGRVSERGAPYLGGQGVPRWLLKVRVSPSLGLSPSCRAGLVTRTACRRDRDRGGPSSRPRQRRPTCRFHGLSPSRRYGRPRRGSRSGPAPGRRCRRRRDAPRADFSSSSHRRSHRVGRGPRRFLGTEPRSRRRTE